MRVSVSPCPSIASNDLMIPMLLAAIIGYIFIVAGALLWWTVITYSVDKVRSHFKISSMWLINRIMGSILLLLSLYGLVTGLWDYFHL